MRFSPANGGQVSEEDGSSLNSKELFEFATFCENHPELGFWTALRDWAKVSFVFVQLAHREPLIDTVKREEMMKDSN